MKNLIILSLGKIVHIFPNMNHQHQKKYAGCTCSENVDVTMESKLVIYLQVDDKYHDALF